MDSILTSVKKDLGIVEEYEHFDPDIIRCINSVFVALAQMGIGYSNGFIITDKSSTWSEFTADDPRLESVKSYVSGKVKLMFDPPTGSAKDALESVLSELEWRLFLTAES